MLYHVLMTDSKERAIAAAAPSELLAGQVIAVTGAESGYGRLLSAAFANAGANVILIGEQPEALAAVASVIEQKGRIILPLKANVGVPLDWQAVQDRMMDIFGVLHGVVHVADRQSHTPFTALGEGEWMEMFNYNIKSSVAIAQMTCRRNLDNWLTIVGPKLSDNSLQSHPQRGALRGLVEQAHLEGMRVNMLLPNRECSGDALLDQAMIRSVLMLADPNMLHIYGNTLTIHLPDIPNESAELTELLAQRQAEQGEVR